jgi:hypothetical protein
VLAKRYIFIVFFILRVKMVDENVKKYLTDGISGGHSVEQLKQNLLNGGFSESVVTGAVAEVTAGSTPATPATVPGVVKEKKSKKKIIILSIIVLFVLALGGFGVYWFMYA